MKFLYASILFFAAHLMVFSQPVIDGSGYTNANTVLFIETSSPLWLANQTITAQSGENQLWNVTDWESFQENTQSFYTLGDVPFSYQIFFNSDFLYPEHVSTHGLLANFNPDQNPLPIQVDDPYAFFRTDETGYYSTGTAFSIEGFPVVTQNDSIERILEFPLVYGGTDTSFISYLTQIPLLGAFGQSGTRTSEVDGWGVLNTPFGEYDVLRVRSEISLTDTLFIEQTGTGQTIERPLEVQYTWVSPDVPGPVLQISVVENVPFSASLFTEDGVLSTEQWSSSALTLFYPNPAHSQFELKAEIEWSSLSILNMEGKEVLSRTYSTSPIDVQYLNSGAYILVIEGENGDLKRSKLIIE